MPISAATLHFIEEHVRDDVRTLALQAAKYPQVDMNIAFDYMNDTPDYKVVKML